MESWRPSGWPHHVLFITCATQIQVSVTCLSQTPRFNKNSLCLKTEQPTHLTVKILSTNCPQKQNNISWKSLSMGTGSSFFFIFRSDDTCIRHVVLLSSCRTLRWLPLGGAVHVVSWWSETLITDCHGSCQAHILQGINKETYAYSDTEWTSYVSLIW